MAVSVQPRRSHERRVDISMMGAPAPRTRQEPPVEIVFSSRIGPAPEDAHSWVQSILAQVRKPDASLVVLFCGDTRMRELNHQFRGMDTATDVLSFPSGEKGSLGNIAIDVAYARREALKRGHSMERELQVLLVHGILHLLGYDHETDDGKMFRLQRRVVASVFGAGPDGVPSGEEKTQTEKTRNKRVRT